MVPTLGLPSVALICSIAVVRINSSDEAQYLTLANLNQFNAADYLYRLQASIVLIPDIRNELRLSASQVARLTERSYSTGVGKGGSVGARKKEVAEWPAFRFDDVVSQHQAKRLLQCTFQWFPLESMQHEYVKSHLALSRKQGDWMMECLRQYVALRSVVEENDAKKRAELNARRRLQGGEVSREGITSALEELSSSTDSAIESSYSECVSRALSIFGSKQRVAWSRLLGVQCKRTGVWKYIHALDSRSFVLPVEGTGKQ